MVWPFLQHDTSPIFIAHRGGNLATENTIEAFTTAKAIGYTYIETDVQVTRDNVVVVFHDSSLNRLTGQTDYISDLPWDELKKVELRGGGTIPRLDDVLNRFPDLKFNIDPKSDRAVRPLAAVIRESKSENRTCVGSFSSRRVRTIQRLVGPKLCTSPGLSAIPWVILRAVFAPNTHPRYACLQIPNTFYPPKFGRWLVSRIQHAGLQVHIWTPNTSDKIIRALKTGADGIITDEVELLQDLRINRPKTNAI